MTTPLNASATSAGSLISSTMFEIPQFQREYAWGNEEVSEFWSDFERNLHAETYFLGLIILTNEGEYKHVIDGQQRLITLTLLALAIHHEALNRGRNALADRIKSDFLMAINYETDAMKPRLNLVDESDQKALQAILSNQNNLQLNTNLESNHIFSSYDLLSKKLHENIKPDPFKQLGIWAEFITSKLYFAVFVHPDSSSAYKVFEVINTRGKELTTADLLKNYILSQVAKEKRDQYYQSWRSIAKQIEAVGEQSFVQYIRHVVTSYRGHILSKDLYDFLAERQTFGSRQPLHPDQLLNLLNSNLDLYSQMMNPKFEGPAESNTLKVFASLNDLSVIAVRPMLLSIFETPDALNGMYEVLRLVVRRIVVGTLGTGNIERRFGEAAKLIRDKGEWSEALKQLQDLNPQKDEFITQLERRTLNKRVLSFIRHSIIQKSITPDINGVLHLIRPRSIETKDWPGFDESEAAYLSGTLGNTFLTKDSRRNTSANSWIEFKQYMLPQGIENEFSYELQEYETWSSNELKEFVKKLAQIAGDVWYENN